MGFLFFSSKMFQTYMFEEVTDTTTKKMRRDNKLRKNKQKRKIAKF